jgi:hypothetical protein
VTPLAAAAELARLLAPGQDTALELGGATAVLEAIAGQQLTADVQSAPGRPLDDREAALLRPGPRDVPCRRHGILRTADGLPASAVTAVFLPRRIPGPARASLGITPAGTAVAGRVNVPLGRALRGFGVRRRQIEAVPGSGPGDAAGGATALDSAGLLEAEMPLALVTERIYAGFLAAFPPPWPRLAALAGPAAPREPRG